MKMKRIGTALAVIGLVLVSGCGGSATGLIKSTESNRDQRNAALDENSGLNVKVYKLDQSLIDLTQGTEWGEGLEGQIKRDDSFFPACEGSVSSLPNIDGLGEIFGSCQAELVVAHYSGYITVPGTEGDANVQFLALNDDGFSMSIDGNSVIDSWLAQGCGEGKGVGSATVTLAAGKSYPIDAWYFQYYGDYCMQLQWDAGGNGLEVIPASAFSKVDPSAPAPTESTDTTMPADTTDTTMPTDTTLPAVDSVETAIIDPANVKPIDAAALPEFSCDLACVAAVRDALGVTTGDVIAVVDGKTTTFTGSDSNSVKLTAGKSIKLSVKGATKSVTVPVQSADAATDTTVAASDTTVATEDTTADSSGTTAVPDYKVDNGSNTMLIIIIVVVVLALIVLVLVLKKRKKS